MVIINATALAKLYTGPVKNDKVYISAFSYKKAELTQKRRGSKVI